MAIELKLPELGENIESGRVASVMVSIGDEIVVDQGILELETDKAVIEVPAVSSGKIVKVLVENGMDISVGQAIILLEKSEKSAPEEQKPEVAEQKSDKPDIIEEAPADPSPPQKVDEMESAVEVREPDRPISTLNEKREKSYLAPASPSVRRFAREIGIDINQVKGTGPGNRILIDDAKAYSKMINRQRKTSGAVLKGVQDEPLPDFSKWGDVDRRPMNKIREKTAAHLSYAWAAIPHVTQFDKADVTELEVLRKKYSAQVKEAGGKLTITAILIKVIEKALKKFPQFNASIDMINKEIIYKKYYNISVATDTERGLLAPVIKNVDQKNITEISVELSELSQKARDRKILLTEMQGGNFSISNLGGIGGTGLTPIVNSPEASILGVSRSQLEPVFLNGDFIPRLMTPLSLSYDHRLIDGADAARFLRWVCEALQDPFLLSLDG